MKLKLNQDDSHEETAPKPPAIFHGNSPSQLVRAGRGISASKQVWVPKSSVIQNSNDRQTETNSTHPHHRCGK